MELTAAQKRARGKYLAKFEQIRIRVPLGDREKIQEAAKADGKSVNAWILELISKAMDGEE